MKTKTMIGVEALLQDCQLGHSQFQIDNFIIGDAHPWGQYKQALRELSARHREMTESAQMINRFKNDIDKKKRGWWWKRNDVPKLEGSLKNALIARKSKAREFCAFYRIARELKRNLGELTPERRRQLEAEMWVDKARRIAAIDLLSIGGLQRSTVEFISQLPRELRRMVLSELRPENRQRLLSIID